MRECAVGVVQLGVARHVGEVDVANLGEGVVPEHGVECFGEVSAARLVDAAGVRPSVAIPMLPRQDAELPEFGAHEIARIGELLEGLLRIHCRLGNCPHGYDG